ncbi:MAG: hypothetical protein KIT72_01620 [Polyangiaceae bacterium]|nr:hypothetical protein [Polyangiaceae bacterium]MCW5789096.1 hypothetical protein [Polyangiaceae bacterium]
MTSTLHKLPFALLTISAAWLGAGLALSGCGEDDLGGTSGQRVTLTTEAKLAPDSSAPFVNDLGWELSVQEAKLSLEALRYFAGAPIARLDPFPTETYATAPASAGLLTSLTPRVLGAPIAPRTASPQALPGVIRSLLHAAQIPSAAAHPGHYVPGEALGEMLTRVVIDLMHPAALPPGTGVTGRYRSGWLQFATPPADSGLGDAVVRVVVRASQGGVSHELQLDATLTDLADGHGDPIIEGCPMSSAASGADGAEVRGDGAIQLEVDLALWLDQLDPSPLTASPERVTVDPNRAEHQTLHRAFRRGIRQAGAYRFSYRPAP